MREYTMFPVNAQLASSMEQKCTINKNSCFIQDEFSFYTQKLPEFGNSRTNRNAYHQGVDNKLFTYEQFDDTITP